MCRILVFMVLFSVHISSVLSTNYSVKFSDSLTLWEDILSDGKLSVPELLIKYKYPSEVHHVLTDDGYILEMHRIPKVGAQPVYLQHGLLDSSAAWIIMGTKQGLGYMLADLGYDVWMGNTRGNRYSSNHSTLEINTKKFWDFSFHELGIHDLPAMIDYVLNQTDYKQLHYVGHSQGTTSFWAMASKRPEYNKKILSMQALAPIAYLNEVRSPFINLMIRILNTLDSLTNLVGIHQFLPSNKLLSEGGQLLCQDKAIFQIVCKNVVFLIAGYDSKQLNATMLPVILAHTPAGASIKQMVHYGQIARSGAFREYDYGIFMNWKKYGHLKPPPYNTSKITAPVIFHYSQNDWLAGVNDVEKLYKSTPNAKGKYLVKLPKFNHLDFIWAIDARKLVYKNVVETLQKFGKNINKFS